MSTNPPTIREELDRKTIQAMNALVLGYKRGRYTAEQVSLGYDVIFQVVSGLVDKETTQIFTESALEMPMANQTLRRYFQHEDGELIIKLVWVTGEDFIMVLRIQFGMVIESKKKECTSAANAKLVFETFGNALISKGWSEL